MGDFDADGGRAEQIRRNRAAQALDATEPAARDWLERTGQHPDARIAALAQAAARGDVAVGEVVAAVEAAEAAERQRQAVRDWIDGHSDEELDRLLAEYGIVRLQVLPMPRLDQAPLSPESVDFVKAAGLWDDDEPPALGDALAELRSAAR